MHFKFIFKNEYSTNRNILRFAGIVSGDEILGFTVVSTNEIKINLSATDWMVYYSFGTDLLIHNISKTIIHEHIHYEVGTGNDEPRTYTRKGEEFVCMILADQI